MPSRRGTKKPMRAGGRRKSSRRRGGSKRKPKGDSARKTYIGGKRL